jgi:endonuclease/exonuclease/phosphatase family metal-dependent hydrolase
MKSAAARLRVASYNIHRAIGLDRRFQPERIVRILQDHDPDIVLLQEVDEGAPRSREQDMARELAAALGYPHYAAGHNVSLRKGRYGNATLSRHPIVRERNIDLTIGDLKRRGCQHTAIDIELGQPEEPFRLEVFNLHLGLATQERQRQAGLLLRSKEFAELDQRCACIVGGDFNDWLSRLRALFVEGVGLRCATDQESQRRTRSMKTYPSFAPRGGLDRIYYRGGLRLLGAEVCRHQLARVASDHLPVIVDFELLGN